MNLKSAIPNSLSLFRIALTVPLLYFYFSGLIIAQSLTIAAIIFSDYLDGYFARKYNSTSAAGKILDPLADKVCTISICAACWLRGSLPLWIFILIIAREIVILAVGLILIAIGKPIPVSNVIGKYAMGIIAFALLVFIYDLQVLFGAAKYLIAAVALFSLANYGWIYLIHPKYQAGG